MRGNKENDCRVVFFLVLVFIIDAYVTTFCSHLPQLFNWVHLRDDEPNEETSTIMVKYHEMIVETSPSTLSETL